MADRTVRYVGWDIMLEDVTLHDGRRIENQLGGGGMYGAAGMRVWSHEVGLHAKVGQDFDFSLLDRLDVDTSGVITTATPTIRCGSIYDVEGNRTDLMRSSTEVVYEQLTYYDLPPAALSQIRGYHFQSIGDPLWEGFADILTRAGVFVGAEPSLSSAKTPEAIQRVYDYIHTFPLYSPNLLEARKLFGDRPVADTLRALAALGPRYVVLRMGGRGSVTYDATTGESWSVPVVPVAVVDVTGGGNAYIGGMIVGLCEGRGLPEAAVMGAVAASFMLEQFGPPTITPALEEQARIRYEQLLPRITRLS
ncbi:MAG: hypothetical protein IT326_10195 [Anaerolineae bacterium]|nr:hypothetical protein [Anaerolineae bacterium]